MCDYLKTYTFLLHSTDSERILVSLPSFRIDMACVRQSENNYYTIVTPLQSRCHSSTRYTIYSIRTEFRLFPVKTTVPIGHPNDSFVYSD